MTAARSTAHTPPMRAASGGRGGRHRTGADGLCPVGGPGPRRLRRPPARRPAVDGRRLGRRRPPPRRRRRRPLALDGAHYPSTRRGLPAGTYATRAFQPAFTAEIDTDLGLRYGGDEDRFVFIGQDKNAPVNADEEWDVMYLDRVLDPVGQRTIEPLDGDPSRLVRAASEARGRVRIRHGPRGRWTSRPPAGPASCRPGPVRQPPPGPPVRAHRLRPDRRRTVRRVRRLAVSRSSSSTSTARRSCSRYQAADDARFADRSGVFDRWVRSVDFQ